MTITLLGMSLPVSCPSTVAAQMDTCLPLAPGMRDVPGVTAFAPGILLSTD